MLAGTREQLDGWLDLIATFDVDLLKGMSVGLFPLENSEVEEVARGLSAMLEGGGDNDQAGPPVETRSRGAGQTAQQYHDRYTAQRIPGYSRNLD